MKKTIHGENMTAIELNPYDREDIVQYLEYAKNKKTEEGRGQKQDNSGYDRMRIDHLINVVRGKVYSGGFSVASSLPPISSKEKEKYGYVLDNKKREEKKKTKIETEDDLLSFLYEEEEEPWWKN